MDQLKEVLRHCTAKKVAGIFAESIQVNDSSVPRLGVFYFAFVSPLIL